MMNATETTTHFSTFVVTKGSKLGKDAPSAKGFSWLVRQLVAGKDISSQCEVTHEGRCGKCGAKLTVGESTARGFGPKCAKDVIAMGYEVKAVFNPKAFILCEKSDVKRATYITVTSKATGKHFTYKIKMAKDKGCLFVSVLTGPNNTSDYSYLGCIFKN